VGVFERTYDGMERNIYAATVRVRLYLKKERRFRNEEELDRLIHSAGEK
jgi:hypothetical protein